MGQPVIFTDLIRRRFQSFLNAIAQFLLRLGLTPNMVTFGGLVGHMVAAALAFNGQMTLAGVVLLFFAPLDALDGAMARLQGKVTKFGALFDSFIDRYGEFILSGGLLGYYLQAQDGLSCLVIFTATAGSAMVPYVRARAEGLGFTARIGLLSRLERYLLIVPALLIDRPMWALWVIAVLANFTAVQRLLHVRSEACKSQ